MSISAPAYTRLNKEWVKWLGKKGTVTLVTTIRVASPEQSAYTPYDYAVVSLETGEKHSFMVAGNQHVAVGDTVTCVLRRLANPTKTGIINYGVKITPLLVEGKS